MKTYIYKVINSSTRRGYNLTIEVYRVIHNVPKFVGYDDKISTASYRGDYATACHIIHRKTGARMAGGYKLASSNIQLFAVQQ